MLSVGSPIVSLLSNNFMEAFCFIVVLHQAVAAGFTQVRNTKFATKFQRVDKNYKMKLQKEERHNKTRSLLWQQ